MPKHPSGVVIYGGLNIHYFKTDQEKEDIYGDPWRLPGELSPVWLRGPEPDMSRPFISCIGAAHTFGRYAPSPFPSQLPIQAANFGVGGGQPLSFLHPEWLMQINKSVLCVIQAPSARASHTSAWRPDQNKAGFAAGDVVLYATGEAKFSGTHWLDLFREHKGQCAKLIQEVQMSYMFDMATLMVKIKVPKVLLFAGEREPDPHVRVPDSEQGIRWAINKYPHMVNDSMWQAMVRAADASVMDISNDNTHYYPTQESHDRIAERLRPVILELLGAYDYDDSMGDP